MGAPVNHKRMKNPPPKQPRHMARVAAMGCIICGGPAEVHHVRTGNMGRDDARVAPLCPFHHRDSRMGFHGLGSERAFYTEWGISLSAVAERLAAESIEMGIMR
jgi:hypothetical protein